MIWKSILLALLAASLALAGPTTQVSDDKRFALTFPDGWELTNERGDEHYQLSAANRRLRQFVALGSDAKEDFVDQTLERFEEQRASFFNTTYTNIEPGETTETKVGPHRAIQRTIRCVSENQRWVYVCTAIETDKSFVYVMCCTTPSRLDDARETFDLIVASFRELNGLATPPEQGK